VAAALVEVEDEDATELEAALVGVEDEDAAELEAVLVELEDEDAAELEAALVAFVTTRPGLSELAAAEVDDADTEDFELTALLDAEDFEEALVAFVALLTALLEEEAFAEVEEDAATDAETAGAPSL
jgi:hypothetical protein